MRRQKRKVPPVTILAEAPAWRRRKSLLPLIRRAAKVTLAALPPEDLPLGSEGGVTILLAEDARLTGLNALFRGKRRPTNVLSFPGGAEAMHMGDIALGAGIIAREARAQRKSFAHHAAHLTVHGILHLSGYDHEKPRQAAAMEALEIRILARLGIEIGRAHV